MDPSSPSPVPPTRARATHTHTHPQTRTWTTRPAGGLNMPGARQETKALPRALPSCTPTLSTCLGVSVSPCPVDPGELGTLGSSSGKADSARKVGFSRDLGGALPKSMTPAGLVPEATDWLRPPIHTWPVCGLGTDTCVWSLGLASRPSAVFFLRADTGTRVMPIETCAKAAAAAKQQSKAKPATVPSAMRPPPPPLPFSCSTARSFVD